MTRPPIRAGFVGAGFFGALLADMCSKHHDFAVLRVCDHDLNAARGLAERTGASVAADVQAIVSDDETDIVFVATPNHTHADIAGTLLAAGKDVFVEKPLTIDATDARELLRLAHDHARVLVTGHIMRSMPGIKLMHKALRSGHIGAPTEAFASRTRLHHAPDHPDDWWKLDENRSGGELLHELHELDLLLWMLGKPAHVATQPGHHLFKTTMTYTSGVISSHELSTASHLSDWQLRVSGTCGTLRADFRRAVIEHWVEGEVVAEWDVFDEPTANKSLIDSARQKQGHHTGGSASPLWMQEAVLRELDEVAAAVRHEDSVLVADQDLAVTVATNSLGKVAG